LGITRIIRQLADELHKSNVNQQAHAAAEKGF
jgi:hypothetical protein